MPRRPALLVTAPHCRSVRSVQCRIPVGITVTLSARQSGDLGPSFRRVRRRGDHGIRLSGSGLVQPFRLMKRGQQVEVGEPREFASPVTAMKGSRQITWLLHVNDLGLDSAWCRRHGFARLEAAPEGPVSGTRVQL